MDQQWLSDNIPTDYRWVETPTLASADVAQAMVDKFLKNEDDGFDFVRQHREPMQLRRVVPYKEIVAYIVAASVLAGAVWLRLGAIRNEHTVLLATAPPMVGDGTNPKPEKDRLNARAVAVSQFLDKRVQWSEVLNEVTHKLPEGMRLTSIRGSAVMSQRRKKQVKTTPTTLVLQAESALDQDNELPVEINTLASSIKECESVGENFKLVELSDVRRTRSQETGVAGAEFSIVLTSETKGAR